MVVNEVERASAFSNADTVNNARTSTLIVRQSLLVQNS